MGCHSVFVEMLHVFFALSIVCILGYGIYNYSLHNFDHQGRVLALIIRIRLLAIGQGSYRNRHLLYRDPSNLGCQSF